MKKIIIALALIAMAGVAAAGLITDPNINTFVDDATIDYTNAGAWTGTASHWDITASGARVISAWSDKKMVYVIENTGNETSGNLVLDWAAIGTGSHDVFFALYGIDEDFSGGGNLFSSSTRDTDPVSAVTLLSDAAYDNNGDGILSINGTVGGSGSVNLAFDTGATAYKYFAVSIGGVVRGSAGTNGVTFDNVDVMVPEPATVGMLGLGALISLLIRRIRSKN